MAVDITTDNLALVLQAIGNNNNSWGTIANQNFEYLEDAITEVATVSTTGGTTTLTTAENRAFVINVTGTLASNATITVADRKHAFMVRNATSGAYTLTVQASGGSGVTVTQGTGACLHSNGAGGITKVFQTVDQSAVVITGGTADALVIGGSTPAAGAFTTINASDLVTVTGTGPSIKLNHTDGYDFWLHVNSNRFYALVDRNGDGSPDGAYPLILDADTNSGTIFGGTIWNSFNDGAGSTLDADLLDGQHGSYYAPIASPTFTGSVVVPTGSWNGGTINATVITGGTADALVIGGSTPAAGAFTTINASDLVTVTGAGPLIKLDDTDGYDFWLHVNSNEFYVLVDRTGDGIVDGASPLILNADSNSGTIFGGTIWNSFNDGAGSTLDADLLDGQHGSYYAPIASPTFTGSVVVPTGSWNGGTINATTIGASTPSTGVFSGLTMSAGHINLAAGSYIGSSVNTANVTIYGGTPGSGSLINLYGPSHGVVPNQIYYDADAHAFRSQNGVSNIIFATTSAVTVTPDLYMSGTALYGDDNSLIQFNDAYLRIDQGNVYTAVYTPGKFRADSGITFTDDTVGITKATATYGSVKTIGTGNNFYSGYNVGDSVSFMHSGTTYGLYDLANNHWGVIIDQGGATNLGHAGSTKLSTTAGGVAVVGAITSGNINVTGAISATGSVACAGGLWSTDGNVYIQAPSPTANAYVCFRDSSGVNRAITYWDYSSGSLIHNFYNSAGAYMASVNFATNGDISTTSYGNLHDWIIARIPEYSSQLGTLQSISHAGGTIYNSQSVCVGNLPTNVALAGGTWDGTTFTQYYRTVTE